MDSWFGKEFRMDTTQFRSQVQLLAQEIGKEAMSQVYADFFDYHEVRMWLFLFYHDLTLTLWESMGGN
jgi:hypothetical protein